MYNYLRHKIKMKIMKQKYFSWPGLFSRRRNLSLLTRGDRPSLTRATCASLVTSRHAAATHGGTGTANPRRWARVGMVFHPNNQNTNNIAAET
jgi:hypothetical protein